VFFAGCCYGKHTITGGVSLSQTAWLLLRTLFHSCSVQTDQLFYSFYIKWNSYFFVIKKFSDRGYISMLFLFLYPIFRFIIEHIRDDPRIFFFGLSDGQSCSILLLLLGIALFLYRRGYLFQSICNHSMQS
jgi:prolipoprotein diacylglyceryltransferase